MRYETHFYLSCTSTISDVWTRASVCYLWTAQYRIPGHTMADSPIVVGLPYRTEAQIYARSGRLTIKWKCVPYGPRH